MGKFERAVNNNEISAFFKGEGDYFSPDEWSWGYHNFMINWMGMMANLEKGENSYQLLVKYFKLYLSSLKEDVLDAWGLFNNLGCFYCLRKDNSYFLTQCNDLISELTAEEKKKIGFLCRYLKDNFDKVPDSASMRPIDEQMKMVKADGCPYDLFSL
ncbi:hypothetical protein DKK70_11290 [Gilliamella apicola]|uniref:Uncharacterized protein n=1 Tax=Gilliamella apicola TaxID=1196095 RepID=A0A2V4E3V4_9GAMM|nr:hypothetical protein [Gilliamella apicola]PXZ06539.1 hypothetical protein DKK70_11290 [Gilliamella apicola]